jgi:hypothetical protein
MIGRQQHEQRHPQLGEPNREPPQRQVGVTQPVNHHRIHACVGAELEDRGQREHDPADRIARLLSRNDETYDGERQHQDVLVHQALLCQLRERNPDDQQDQRQYAHDRG